MADGLRFSPLDFTSALDKDLLEHVTSVATSMKDELKAQGHNLTGRLTNSIKPVRIGPQHYGVEMEDYGERVSTGISASEVRAIAADPLKRRAFVYELAAWVMRRGIERTPFQARSAAGAMFRVGMRTGFPLPGAYKFTRNGRRTGFIELGILANPEPTEFKSFTLAIETAI